MKTKKIYIVLLFAFILGCMRLQSQVVEKEIDGTIFVFDYTKKYAENKNNKISKLIDNNTCRFGIDSKTSLYMEFQKIFSKERLKELHDVSLSFTCYCDIAGFVREVKFRLFGNSEKIKLIEFKEMEDILKTYQFKFSGTENCDEEYFIVHYPFRFRYYNE